MDQETLRRVQLTQLEILKKFKEICEKHDLRYILSSGTLLGAVRHKGFIPWDDDVDVDMPRADYEKFLKAASAELGEEFSLQTWHNDENYPLPFAKIRMNGTIYRENAVQKEGVTGIYIDVFPYDLCSDSESKNEKLFRKLNRINLFITEKTGYLKSGTKTFRLKAVSAFIRFVNLFVSKAKWIGKYEKLAAKYNESDATICFASGGSRIGSWRVAKECFEKTAEIGFENEYFACPKDYDKYLSDAYGDYMTPPPMGDRMRGHGIVEVRFRQDTE